MRDGRSEGKGGGLIKEKNRNSGRRTSEKQKHLEEWQVENRNSG